MTEPHHLSSSVEAGHYKRQDNENDEKFSTTEKRKHNMRVLSFTAISLYTKYYIHVISMYVHKYVFFTTVHKVRQAKG